MSWALEKSTPAELVVPPTLGPSQLKALPSAADEYIAGERRGTISGGGDIGLSGATGAAGFEQSEVGGGQRGERR
jgi:hypothetical protein